MNIINHTADRARLVCLVGDEEGGVDGLHARRAREAPHEPVVDTLGVVGVHARKVADAVADAELDHADHAPERKKERKEVNTCEETISVLNRNVHAMSRHEELL